MLTQVTMFALLFLFVVCQGDTTSKEAIPREAGAGEAQGKQMASLGHTRTASPDQAPRVHRGAPLRGSRGPPQRNPRSRARLPSW